jgi:hypothetical protein
VNPTRKNNENRLWGKRKKKPKKNGAFRLRRYSMPTVGKSHSAGQRGFAWRIGAIYSHEAAVCGTGTGGESEETKGKRAVIPTSNQLIFYLSVL